MYLKFLLIIPYMLFAFLILLFTSFFYVLLLHLNL